MTAILDLVVGQSKDSKTDEFVKNIFEKLVTPSDKTNEKDNPVFKMDGKIYHTAETTTTGFFSRYFMMRKLARTGSELTAIWSDMTSFREGKNDAGFDKSELLNGFDRQHYINTFGNISAHVLSIFAVVGYAAVELAHRVITKPGRQNWGLKNAVKGTYNFVLDFGALLLTTVLSITDSALGLVHDVLDLFYIVTKPIHYLLNRQFGKNTDVIPADGDKEAIKALVDNHQEAYKAFVETLYGVVTFVDFEIIDDVKAKAPESVEVTLDDAKKLVVKKKESESDISDIDDELGSKDETKVDETVDSFINLFNGVDGTQKLRAMTLSKEAGLFGADKGNKVDFADLTLYRPAVEAS
ncbi:MAG: hypothetical protein P8L77_00490 [Gammaproteobacteria bacterium]|nr:hypothetical protein [Gammaproteobacteria bacterium]